MDKYTLGEVAYKNGYDKGFKDGVNKFADKLINLFEENIASIEEEYSGNMYVNQSVKTMKFVIQDIKDTLKELTEGGAE